MTIKFFLFTTLLFVIAFFGKVVAVDDVNIIHRHLDASRTNGRHKGCTIGPNSRCSLKDMVRDESHLVYPGGQTRCIFSTSTPFAFQIFPGDSDKLIFYFQGGGACWDAYSTKMGLCSTDATPQTSVGIFDRTNTNNAFRSHTIVHVLYCSGDVHGGNVVRSYNDNAGQPVTQVGLLNAQSAIDWIKEQITAGALASTFSSLVVMGCSAGSLGTQIWSKKVLDSFSWKRAAVVPDSYAGVFPPNSEGPLVYNYGYCESGFLNAANYQKCINQKLTITDINLEFISAYPKVPFVFIQAKTDDVQISFYDSMAISINASVKSITPAAFYQGVNDIFGQYNSQEANFVTYLIDGSHHCYTQQALYFTADTKGANDNGQTTTTIPLYKYLNQLPLASGASIDTECDGSVQAQLGVKADTTYCSSKLVPKTYTQK